MPLQCDIRGTEQHPGPVPKCRTSHDALNPIESIWVNLKSSKQLV